MTHALRLAALVVSLLPAGLAAQSDQPALTLVGENGVQKPLSRAELEGLPQVEVRVTNRDSSTSSFRGPTLRSLLTLVGAPTGPALRGPAMLLAVVVEATDGYRVVFALAELDEQFGNREAILALTQDGAAVPDRDGPFRIVVPAEQHRARWARNVVRLRLVTVKP